MDFSTAFRYFREDPTWTRKFSIAVLIGGISAAINIPGLYQLAQNPADLGALGMLYGGLFLSLIPSCILSGYIIDISRNVRDGQKEPLPEWSAWHQFKQGASLSIGAMIYSIPFALIMGCMIAAAMIPFVMGLESGSDAMAGFGVMSIVSTVLGAIAMSMLMGFFMSALQINYIRHNTFKSLFQFQDIKFVIGNRWKPLVKIMLFTVLVSGLAGGIASGLNAAGAPMAQIVLTVLISVTITPWLSFVSGHLYGQVASMIDRDKLDAADHI